VHSSRGREIGKRKIGRENKRETFTTKGGGVKNRRCNAKKGGKSRGSQDKQDKKLFSVG